MTKKEAPCGADHYTELAMHLVFSALNNPKLLELKNNLRRLENEFAFKQLVRKGCNADLLRECLAYSRELAELAPAVEIAKLRKLAENIEAVIVGFGELMPSRLIPVLSDTEPAELTFVPISGDFHVSEQLELELRRKAGVCRHVLGYYETNGIPQRGDLRQLADVWPALYAHEATGEYNYALVGELLAAAKSQPREEARSESSLSHSMGRVRKDFAPILPWMLPTLHLWHLASKTADIRVEIEAAHRAASEDAPHKEDDTQSAP